MTTPSPQQPPQGKQQIKTPTKKKGRGFGRFFNLLLLIGLVAVGWLFYQAEQRRSAAEEELQRTASQLEELRQSTQNSGQQVAAEVLNKLRNHMDIPAEPQPTVATITDVDRLRETNEFYNKAENGDHLVITETRAILYDPDRDLVLDVVPVRINRDQLAGSPAPTTQENDAAESPATGSPEAAASPGTSPTP